MINEKTEVLNDKGANNPGYMLLNGELTGVIKGRTVLEEIRLRILSHLD